MRFKTVMFLFVKLLNVYLMLIIYVRNVDFVIAICMFLKNDPDIFPFPPPPPPLLLFIILAPLVFGCFKMLCFERCSGFVKLLYMYTFNTNSDLWNRIQLKSGLWSHIA